MTTGNVSRASFIVDTVISGNTGSHGIGSGNDFQKVIDNVDTTGKTVKSAATGTMIGNNKVRDNVRQNKTETEKIDDGTAEQLVQDIKNTVKDILEISDEELEQAMSELGITIAELLVPQNVANLIATVKDTSAVGIVTDDELSKLLAKLNSGIAEVVEQFASDNNVTFENAVYKLAETVNNETTVTVNEIPEDEATEDEMIHKTEVHDLDDVRTAEVTIEDAGNLSENVTHEEKSMDSDSGKGKSDVKDRENTAHNIIQNISDAVMAAVEHTAEMADVNRIDGADIVRQIVDSVKVNVTEELQSLEINLNPENLGKLNLVVAAKDGIITASITAQNEAVKNAIENQITMLKEQLNNQGIKVQEVEVTVASHEFDANMDNGNNGNSTDNKSNARKRFRGIDEITDEDRNITENNGDLIDSNISLKA